MASSQGPSSFPISRSSLAFLVALGVIGFLTFIVFPVRRITVVADGFTHLVVTRDQSDTSVLRQAGVALATEDVVAHKSDGWGEHELIVSRAVPVIVFLSNKQISWRTQAKTVGAALAEIGVTLGQGDKVFVNGVVTSPDENLVPAPGRMVSDALMLARVALSPLIDDQNPLSILVKRAVPFNVDEDGHSMDLLSTEPDVGSALRDNGIQLRPEDLVMPALDTPLAAGLNVEVRHAAELVITDPNGDNVVYTHERTVGAALSAAGIEIGEKDRLSPGPDEPVSDGLTVEVFRVGVRSVVEREDIPFETLFKGDPNLAWGDTRRTEGSNGVHAREYEVTYENGIEISRELARDYVEVEPTDAVVYYSAGSDYQGDMPDNYHVVSVLHVYATWYNPASAGKPAGSPGYGITSTGVQVTRGIVAVDPTVIPYGTKMFIPGYGFAVAADCGGGIKGNMIDLGYPDGVESDWSTRWVDIYILG